MRVLVKVLVTLTVFHVPHQPRAFHFPKREFGKKSAVRRSFQTAWFDKWPWLHYREENDSVSCYTCLKAKLEKKLSWAANADAAFTDKGYTNWKDATVMQILSA